ncbi:PDDEXK nuclease domain-containing protein [Microbacterium yannicii]|uniref:PDDEXK nuclease domain-containing protein n=1 Tax=Microbacterium yannicii TaxID=671622 RepID=UPI0002F244B5|nr:PDDEXK nuclease domain-containing protein [Microbacterium yannicii]
MSEVEPADYRETLEALKRRVHDARFRLQRRANAELVALYWHIGDTILKKQDADGWGAGVVTRLAKDLQAEFPTMRGFSRTNLFLMRAFAAAWPERNGIVQQPVGQLPWTHIQQLMEKLDDQKLREWYAGKDIQHTWSRAVLVHHLTTRLHERDGAAPSNFAAALTRADSELAQQLTKDPYTMGFLGVDADSTEREFEERLTQRIVDTLRELGSGFAFIGRQHHIEVDGDDFYIDLLFFHIEQLRYVVFELKTRKYDPRDAGQLGFYVALVDERLRLRDRHAPTVGILLVAEKNETVVRYSLAGSAQPMAVSRYELSAAEQAALPTEDALTRLAAEVADAAPEED